MKLAYLGALVLAAGCTAPSANEASANGNVQAGATTNEAAQPRQPSPPNGSEQPRADVQLSASPAQARAGDTMTLQLTNGSSQTVGYNLCTSALQAAGGSAVPTDRVCTMELRSLPPGQSTTYPYELPETLEPGSYRFATDVERMETGDRQSLTSNSFEVR